jgi:hypothetical protein
MPEIKIHPFLKNIIVLFLFFALGRILVIQVGPIGIWIVVIAVIVYYAIWWVNYQRSKKG